MCKRDLRAGIMDAVSVGVVESTVLNVKTGVHQAELNTETIREGGMEIQETALGARSSHQHSNQPVYLPQL